LIILRIFAHVMSRCYLDLWPLDLELFTAVWVSFPTNVWRSIYAA